jgi:transcriptional regulator with XRE-family HTH domain
LPASPYSSVQKAREQLAARLVEIRKDAGINSRELARRLGWYESKVSRIVNAITPPSEDDIRAWCAACDAGQEIPGLIASLRLAEGAYVEWRRMERAGLRAAQESVLPLYERTRRFRAYSSSVLPGMIQTRAYTTAVLRNIHSQRGLVDDVEAAVEVRMDRRRLLDARGNELPPASRPHAQTVRDTSDADLPDPRHSQHGESSTAPTRYPKDCRRRA